jgi:glutaredoxin 2
MTNALSLYFCNKRLFSMDVFHALIGLLGGAGGYAVSAYTAKKQESRSDFTELLDKYKLLYDEIKSREHKCEEELKQVVERLRVYESKVALMDIEIVQLKNQMPNK